MTGKLLPHLSSRLSLLALSWVGAGLALNSCGGQEPPAVNPVAPVADASSSPIHVRGSVRLAKEWHRPMNASDSLRISSSAAGMSKTVPLVWSAEGTAKFSLALERSTQFIAELEPIGYRVRILPRPEPEVVAINVPPPGGVRVFVVVLGSSVREDRSSVSWYQLISNGADGFDDFGVVSEHETTWNEECRCYEAECPRGTIQISVEREGYMTASMRTNVNGDVPPTAVEVRLTPEGKISGAFDAEGRDAVDGRVWLSRIGHADEASESALVRSGAFEFRGLAAGEYELEADLSGWILTKKSPRVAVEAGKTSEWTIPIKHR